jgi:Flp pilus assembly pilin Flp
LPKLIYTALRDQVGAASVEYALLASFMAAVIITAVGLLRNPFDAVFKHVASLF